MENKRLNERLGTLLAMESENSALKSQINYAQFQMNKLLDENKEMEMKIKELQTENALLQKRATDPSNFMNWTHEEILSWITSSDGGYFEKYRIVLARELKDCDMKGSDLCSLNSNDIRGLGVKVFHDAKKLERSIQKFVQQYGTAMPVQQVADQNLLLNEGAPTAYLYK